MAGPKWPDLARAPATPGGGENDAAVIVGVEKYVGVPGVPGAVQNADDWYAFLVNGRKVPASSVTLLRNNEATVEKMRKHATAAANLVKPGGTLWFVFIGHGAPAEDGKDGILVGFDAQQDPESLYARSLRQKDLVAALSNGKQARTLLVMDACFSGRAPDGSALAQGLQPLIALKAPAAAAPEAKPVTILSAGGADQFAGPLPGIARPAFSYLVLGALRGWADGNADAQVTAREALDYARMAIQTTVKGRSQEPQLHGAGGDWILSSSMKETGPDLAAIAQGDKPRGSGRGESELITVAIAPFRSDGLPEELRWAGKSFGDALHVKLTRIPNVRIVENEFLEQILSELKLQRTDLVDPSTAVAAGSLLGAKLFIFGSVVAQGQQLLVRARIVDVETRSERDAVELFGATGRIFAAQAELAKEVATALTLTAAMADGSQLEGIELATATSSELDRLRVLAAKLPWYGLDPARRQRGGDYQLALSITDRLVSTYPKLAAAHYYRAQFALHSEDYDTAERESAVALQLASSELESWLLRANVQQARNDFAGATATLRDVSTRFPADSRGWYGLGRLHLAAGQKDAAAVYLLASLERQPFLTDAEGALRTLVAGGDGPAVLAGVQRMDARLHPAAASYRALWRNELTTLGPLAWQAVKASPQLYVGYLTQALLERNANQPARAEQFLRVALSLRPSSPETHRELGLLLLARRDCASGARHVNLYLRNANVVSDFSQLQQRIDACR